MRKETHITTETGNICIPFPQKKFRAYLKNVQATTRKKLTKEQIQKIFLMAIADFYSGALSLDELSGIANEIYYPNIPIGDRDLDPVLDYASELSYNIRQIDTKHRGAEGIGLGESIATIRQYYEQHKHANTT